MIKSGRNHMYDKSKLERGHTDNISTIPTVSTLASSPVTRRVCLLVLGMHRSGTSALTRVLNILGCDLPKTLMVPCESNPTGHWESQRIADLNDEILASAGSSWHDWLEFHPGWARSPKAVQFRERARQIVHEEFGTSTFFVLKDPRICRMVPFWLEVLEENGASPIVIFPLRNPLEVAASLEKRDGFDPLFGQLLWLRNVLDAEYSSRGLRRSFATYDSLLSGPNRLAADAEGKLGISWPRPVSSAAKEIEDFLSGPDHRHHAETLERVLADPLMPGWLRDTFRILSKWTVDGEQSDDFVTLDHIRTELNAAGPAFARLVSAGRNATAKVRHLESTVTDLRARLQITEAEMAEKDETTRQYRDEISQSRAESEKSLAELAQRLTQTESELVQQRQKADDAAAGLAAAHNQIATLVSARTETDMLAANLKQQAELLIATIAAKDESYGKLADCYQDLTVKLREGSLKVSRLSESIDELKADAVQARSDAARLQTSQLEIQRLKESQAELQQAKAAAESATAETVVQLEKARNDANNARAELQSLQRELSQVKLTCDKLQEQLDATKMAAQLEVEKAQQAGLKAEAEKLALEARLSERFEEIKQFTRLLQGYEELKVEAAKVHAEAALLPSLRHELDQLKSRNSDLERAATVSSLQLQEARAAAEAIGAERRKIEDQLGERFREIAALTRLLQQKAKRQTPARFWLKRFRMAVNPLRWSRLKRELMLDREMAKIKKSGHFDALWYLTTYSDVAEAAVDPLRHYAAFGITEGRKPNASC